MGNKSRYGPMIAAAAGVVGIRAAVKARRRARLRYAAEGIGEAIMPSLGHPEPSAPVPLVDEAHAPGHQHLGRTSETEREPAAPPGTGGPWIKHAHSRHRRG